MDKYWIALIVLVVSVTSLNAFIDWQRFAEAEAHASEMMRNLDPEVAKSRIASTKQPKLDTDELYVITADGIAKVVGDVYISPHYVLTASMENGIVTYIWVEVEPLLEPVAQKGISDEND